VARLVINLSDFEIRSGWTVYQEWDDNIENYVTKYTPPSNVLENVYAGLAGMPAGALVTHAELAAVMDDPWTGWAVRSLDGTTYNSPRDITAQLQALNGVYAGQLAVPFGFRFKANGRAGGLGTRSAMLHFTHVTLTIDYNAPASTGSLSLSDLDIGQTVRLQSIVTQDASYTHKAVWTLNGQGEVVQNLGANPGFTDFTLPAAWLAILPAVDAGVAAVRLETYSAAGELLGSNSYAFTARVAAAVLPTITGLAAAKYSDTSPAVPAAWNKFVRNKSKAVINASVAAGAGSSIKAIKVECMAMGFVAYTLPCTSWRFSAAGELQFTVTVTDQRNRQTVQQVPVTVEDYAQPGASGILFSRALTNGGAPNSAGTFIRGITTITGTPYGSINPITAKAYYRQAGTTTWLPSGGVAVTSGVAFWMGGGAINPAYPYEVKIDAADYFGIVPVSAPQVPTAAKWWDFQADRAAFGRYATNAKEFSLPDDWDIRFKGKTIIAAVRDVLFPVGAIYMSASGTDPSVTMGGTWAAYGAGRVPVGFDGSNPYFNQPNKIGGESTHTLTDSEMPRHSHKESFEGSTYSLTYSGLMEGRALGYDSSRMMPSTGDAGYGLPHNNLQPYIVCYMWQRIA